MECEMTTCTATNDIRDIKDDIAEIKSALLGNEYNPRGAIKRIDKLEDDVKDISGRMTMVKWVAVGYMLAGVGAGAWITKILL